MEVNSATQEIPKEEKVLIEWQSPSRMFKKRDKEYFTNIGAIVFLLTIILIFAREFVLVATMLSIVFLIYVLSTVPPEEVKHRMTNLGIESAGHYYRWQEFVEFWFEEQWGQRMLVLRPIMGTRTVILLASTTDKDKLKVIIERYIPFREQPDKTWAENAASWLSQKIPLEKPQS